MTLAIIAVICNIVVFVNGYIVGYRRGRRYTRSEKVLPYRRRAKIILMDDTEIFGYDCEYCDGGWTKYPTYTSTGALSYECGFCKGTWYTLPMNETEQAVDNLLRPSENPNELTAE